MSRLGGGIGTRGPGETKIEVDRQHIRRRITKLRRDIVDLERTRAVKRGRRERTGIPQVAVAGYTNAGKSTLLNVLTGAGTLVADQPFATLDPLTRRLVLPGGRAVTVSDTVGFVRRLPHDLVEAFKSTLEEVARADLILHVADASVHDLPDQIAAVREVLGEIGAAELPEVVLLNKWDLVDEMERARLERRHPDAVPVSALTGDGAERVLAAMAEALPRLNDVTLLVPHDRSDVVPWLYREEQVVSTDAGAEGTLVRARVSERGLARVEPFRVPPPSAARAQS
jgi:GTP-binding protein HflX